MGFKKEKASCQRKADALNPRHMGVGSHYHLNPREEFARARRILDSDED